MTCRPLSSKDSYSYFGSRLNQKIKCETTGEGCSVIEESGTVCGETNTLSILKEFRQIYDDCLKKLEEFPNGSATLGKLAPFTKLIEDLLEQNTMLVETVEELEQEATNKVTNLQDKLNKSCQKIKEYKEDVASLIKAIHCFRENGEIDLAGLKFHTLCPSCLGGVCNLSCNLCCCDDQCSRKSSVSFCDSKRFKCRELKASNKSSSLLPVITESKCGKSPCIMTETLSRNSSSKKLGFGRDVKGVNQTKRRNYKKSKTYTEPQQTNSKSDRFDNTVSCFDNCEYSCSGNLSNVSQIEDPDFEDNEFGQCMRSININLNIGNDSNDDCDCDCDCLCAKADNSN